MNITDLVLGRPFESWAKVISPKKIGVKDVKLTARDHRQGEEHHSPGQQIQAASLISGGPPTGLQGQTCEQAHSATHGSC